MGMLSWLGKRTVDVTTAVVAYLPHPETDVERRARLIREYAERDRLAALAAKQRQQRDAEDQAQREEAARELIARCMLRNGAHFPGDAPDVPRGTRSGGPSFTPLEGEWGDDGRYFGWYRF